MYQVPHVCVGPQRRHVRLHLKFYLITLRYISYDIIHSGSFERATVERMARSLDSQRPSGATSPYGLVVDAGANIGQYTLVSAIKGFRTISIEPRPDHVRSTCHSSKSHLTQVDMIARSLVMNGVENNVQLYQNAIGDVRGVRTFNVWTRNMGGSGFMPVANPKDFSKVHSHSMIQYSLTLSGENRCGHGSTGRHPRACCGSSDQRLILQSTVLTQILFSILNLTFRLILKVTRHLRLRVPLAS